MLHNKAKNFFCQGKTVNFENTILVMTTNAGSDKSAATVGFFSGEESGDDGRTMKALNSFLRPEFINRVDEVITFRSLSEVDFEAIARIMLDELKTSLGEKNIAFTYSDDTVAYIAKNSYSYKFGARNMRRFIQSNVEDLIADLIISDYQKQISGIALKYLENENKLTVECI